MTRWRVVLILVAVWLVATSALAHAVGLSQAHIQRSEDTLQLEMVLARNELIGAVPALRDVRALDAGALAKHHTAIEQALTVKLESKSGCSAKLASATLTEEDGVRLLLVSTCKDTTITIHADYIEAFSHGHRQIMDAAGKNEVLYRGHTQFLLESLETGTKPLATSGPSFLGLLHMGITHILSFDGYDHLLFLLGLVLVGGTFRSLALVITSFTVAHSVALACAVLGWFTPSSRLVEPAIALSIAYVGVETFVVKKPQRRWLLSLVFGFVHGFAFAGALREISLARAQVPMALLSFNLGVEAGQLVALAVLLPLLLWLRTSEAFARHGVRAISAGVALVGLGLFVQRVFFT
jgi:hypothetical protein